VPRSALQGVTPDALPLLSFTLWVLWRDFGDDRVIELSEYDRLGGLQGAVVREADALVGNADHQELRHAWVVLRLVWLEWRERDH